MNHDHDPLPSTPPLYALGCRCTECGRSLFGLVETIVHYELRHRTKDAA